MNDGLPTRTQLRRSWVRRYARPRHATGQFTKGAYLYTRFDGEPRWLRHRWDAPDDEQTVDEAHWLTDEFHRFASFVLAAVVVAFVLFWLGWV